jgi:hypothetical protein
MLVPATVVSVPRTVACVLGARLLCPATNGQEAIQRLAEGATQADLARTYNVSQATISRLGPSPFAAVPGAA